MISQSGNILATVRVPYHTSYSRWRWQSAPRPIIRTTEQLVAERALLPIRHVLPPSETVIQTGGVTVSESEKELHAMKPLFSPEVNLGHLLQAGTIIVMVGGAALTSYISLRSDIISLNGKMAVDLSETNARLIKQISDTNARIIALEVRRPMDEAFQAETRQSLTKLLEAITDLRVQVVGKQDKPSNIGIHE
jgi:hypothetical protein